MPWPLCYTRMGFSMANRQLNYNSTPPRHMSRRKSKFCGFFPVAPVRFLWYSMVSDRQRYRSGHNGADSKSVWCNSHVGSNPTVSAKIKSRELQGFSAFSVGISRVAGFSKFKSFVIFCNPLLSFAALFNKNMTRNMTRI